jgi:hypothetical protein
VTLRKGHGKGSGEPRVEVLPPDELPAPVPAAPVALALRENGTIADSLTAKEYGARGGRERARRAREHGAMCRNLGLTKLADDHLFAPYLRSGNDFVRTHLDALAMQAGGQVGPGPSSIVATAGVQLAASRYFSDCAAMTLDPALFHLASSLGNASRQNLLAAYELAVREGKARSAIVDDGFFVEAKR